MKTTKYKLSEKLGAMVDEVRREPELRGLLYALDEMATEAKKLEQDLTEIQTSVDNTLEDALDEIMPDNTVAEWSRIDAMDRGEKMKTILNALGVGDGSI